MNALQQKDVSQQPSDDRELSLEELCQITGGVQRQVM